MNKIKLACSLASLALASQAFALTQVENSGIVPVAFLSGPGFINPATGTPSGGALSTGPDLTLTVPGFTAAAGIYLQSVTYVLETWTYATYTLQNFEQTSQTHGVGWRLLGAELDLPAGAGPSVTGISTPTSNYDIFNMAPSAIESGTTESTFNARPSASGGATAPYLAANVNFTFTPTGSGSVSGSTGNSIPSVFVAARVTVTYTYSDVPEASTYAAGAFLLAGAGFVVRRRMAAK
jgi:hypothetical protein